MYDYILKGGIVVDGTGVPAIEADVAVKDGKIIKIEPGIKEPGQRGPECHRFGGGARVYRFPLPF